MNTLYYTPTQVMSILFTGVDGKPLISRATLMRMIKKGTIPSKTLGLERRYFIPSDWVVAQMPTSQV